MTSRHLSTIWRVLMICATVPCIAGCPNIRRPNFAHPGTAAQQRAEAEQFDPFPDPDAGPRVEGGRPPGFTRPLTETEWGRRYAIPPGGLAAPSLPMSPAPIITNPFPPSPPPAFSPSYPPPIPMSTVPGQVQPRSPY